MKKVFLSILVLVLLSAGCVNSPEGGNNDVGLANPAAVGCEELDGEYLLDNGDCKFGQYRLPGWDVQRFRTGATEKSELADEWLRIIKERYSEKSVLFLYEKQDAGKDYLYYYVFLERGSLIELVLEDTSVLGNAIVWEAD